MHVSLHEEGQGLAEYGWSIILIAILVVVILALLGLTVFDLWDVVAQAWTDIWSRF